MDRRAEQQPLDERLNEIISHSSYKLAYLDQEYITRKDLRPLRLELELLKPQMMLEEANVKSTVVVFGGTQIVSEEEADQRVAKAKAACAANSDNPTTRRELAIAEQVKSKTRFYDECRQFARIVSIHNKNYKDGEYVIKTGGGPGIMEAANRGAFDVGSPSIGLNIILPFEQVPNPYVTPGLCFQFNYFAIRKMHFLIRAKALVCFPGGFGTLDEIFTSITLRQTSRMQDIPIILYGEEYWKRIIDFQYLADQGVVQDHHLSLFSYADSPQQAWKIITDFHGIQD